MALKLIDKFLVKLPLISQPGKPFEQRAQLSQGQSPRVGVKSRNRNQQKRDARKRGGVHRAEAEERRSKQA